MELFLVFFLKQAVSPTLPYCVPFFTMYTTQIYSLMGEGECVRRQGFPLVVKINKAVIT